MSDRVAILLARRADVFRAMQARRRFIWSWIAQVAVWGVLIGGGFLGTIQPQWVPLLLLASGCVLLWSAVEAAILQSALREPPGVWLMTLLGMLVPVAAPILAVVLLFESVAVLKIAKRMRKEQCANCGYDLRGLTTDICPECGWRMERG